MVCRLRRPRGLVTLEPGPIHAERVEDELAVDLVERPTGRLLHEDPGDHIAGVRIPEALAGRERRRSVRGRMVHQLDRTPGAARVLAEPRHERLFAEVVGHARGMREQLARRGPRKGIEGAPAVEQLGSKLVGEWLIERQAPLAGEPDGHHGGHALRDARRAEGVVRPKGTAAPAGQCPAEPPQVRPARGASTRASAPGAPAATCASSAAWRRADTPDPSTSDPRHWKPTIADVLTHKL